jgi:hypothetical protein
MSERLRVNGTYPSFASIELTLGQDTFTDFRSINFSGGPELASVFGAGLLPEASPSATLTLKVT